MTVLSPFILESVVNFENVREAVGVMTVCDCWEDDVSLRSRFRRERLGVNLHRDWAFRLPWSSAVVVFEFRKKKKKQKTVLHAPSARAMAFRVSILISISTRFGCTWNVLPATNTVSRARSC